MNVDRKDLGLVLLLCAGLAYHQDSNKLPDTPLKPSPVRPYPAPPSPDPLDPDEDPDLPPRRP